MGNTIVHKTIPRSQKRTLRFTSFTMYLNTVCIDYGLTLSAFSSKEVSLLHYNLSRGFYQSYVCFFLGHAILQDLLAVKHKAFYAPRFSSKLPTPHTMKNAIEARTYPNQNYGGEPHSAQLILQWAHSVTLCYFF